MMSYDYPHPVSRTYQYKKITKPLLERKRRARINRCLDELKDLMVDALETEGENISKLEKADILELTVRHLQRLQASRSAGLAGISTATTTTATATTTTTGTTTIANDDDATAESRWQSGFGHCAAEACRFLAALPGEAAENLARHLAAGLQNNSKANSLHIKPDLSTTLINLDQSNLVVSCPISPLPATDTSAIVSNVQIPANNRTTPYYIDIENAGKFKSPSSMIDTTTIPAENFTKFINNDRIKSNLVKKTQRDSTIKGKSNSQRINAEDEEEIDVERVDDGDPMWRPW